MAYQAKLRLTTSSCIMTLLIKPRIHNGLNLVFWGNTTNHDQSTLKGYTYPFRYFNLWCGFKGFTQNQTVPNSGTFTASTIITAPSLAHQAALCAAPSFYLYINR